MPQILLANPYSDYAVVEYQRDEENRVNLNFQTFLAACGEGLIPYLNQADKIEFLENGRKIHLSSVETEWRGNPDTFGELGGEVEVSSKVERIVSLKNGQCTTKRVNYPFTLSRKQAISYADKGLMTCASTALQIYAEGFSIAKLDNRLVKEYPKVPVSSDSLDSNQRQDYVHLYSVINTQGIVVGYLEHKFRRDLNYVVMGHTDINVTQQELSCSFIKVQP